MTAQDILDTLHKLFDARQKVGQEMLAEMKRNPKTILTPQHMPSWAESVVAEKAMLRTISLMPRDAHELDPLPPLNS